MPQEHGTVLIYAPVETVFDYLADPHNLKAMLQANMITEVGEAEALPDCGYRYTWQYRILGKTLTASSQTVVCERPTRFAVRSTGGVETISAWTLAPVAEGTHATFSIEYAMSDSLLSWLTARFAVNQIRYSVEIALMALRDLVHQEVGYSSAARPERPTARPDEAPAPRTLI